ncbi:DNA-binding domain-containing protein [Vibrio sp. S11_S32]|uniref:MobH family relaxase n=1 Tax=Vibrio sp. S11_S32 TaxID=2720225 RepID=UPI001680B01A|nr:MobH family relaxase [Vibrio sp. S11_S32]MBD1577836.1 DNA-binding domain-containing protein [Vibrio sp. S11_S32]
MALSFLKRNKKPTKQSNQINVNYLQPVDNGWYEVPPLNYWTEKHNDQIQRILSSARMNKIQLGIYYQTVIDNLILYIQGLPASQYNHHQHIGGLIDHVLDVMYISGTYRRNFLYSESGKELDVENEADVFAYACFCAAALHDIGKIITDIEVVYKSNIDSKPKAWNPTSQPLAEGSFYKFRYRAMRGHKAHTSAAPIMLTHIIPEEGVSWIRGYPKLFQFWLQSIAGQYQDGGAVADVLKYSDAKSAEKNLLSGTNVEAKNEAGVKYSGGSTSPVEIVFNMLRMAIESGQVKTNKAGGMMWVSETHVYLVSKPTVETCRRLAQETGYTVLPTNNIIIFSMLCEAGYTERHHETDDLVHHILVKAVQEDNSVWEQQLTFLKMRKDKLDPNNTLGLQEANATFEDKTTQDGRKAKAKQQSTPETTHAKESSKSKDTSKNDTSNSIISMDLSSTHKPPTKKSASATIVVPTKKVTKKSMPKAGNPVAAPNSNPMASTTVQTKVSEPVVAPNLNQINDDNMHQKITQGNVRKGNINPFSVPNKPQEPMRMQNPNPLAGLASRDRQSLDEFQRGNALVSAWKSDKNTVMDVSAKDFLHWLAESIKNQKIKHNHNRAAVVIAITEGFFICSPNVFNIYESSHNDKKINRSKIITELRKSHQLELDCNAEVARQLIINKTKKITLNGFILKNGTLPKLPILESNIATLIS